MEAQEIKRKGRLVKNWKVSDGSWYTDYYYIYEVEGKYYQIKNHEGNSFGCTGSKFGLVTEVEKPDPLPTHIGVILGIGDGRVWVEDQFQGVPDQIAEWYNAKLQYFKKDYLKSRNTYCLKIVDLIFD